MVIINSKSGKKYYKLDKRSQTRKTKEVKVFSLKSFSYLLYSVFETQKLVSGRCVMLVRSRGCRGIRGPNKIKRIGKYFKVNKQGHP